MKHFRNSMAVLTAALLLPTSLCADEPQVAVTVYNQDLALVREVRTLDLEDGVQEYAYDGVAEAIDPTSVRFSADGVTVLEQNFEFDLVGREALLETYLGEVVDVRLEDEVLRGTLLSTRGGIMLEEGDGEVRLVEPSAVVSVRFPALPEGLIVKPTLRWLLEAGQAGEVSGELNYLTRQVSWEASYVAVVGGGDTSLELSGWVQVTNRSGATWRDATLKLMAGDVRVEGPGDRARMVEAMMAGKAADHGFQEKAFFEYHLYTLPRPVTLQDNQVKQIRLVAPVSTPARKQYLFDTSAGSKVMVNMEFTNSEEAGLGMPLPAGKVRLYKRDEDESLQLVGEDRIEHTPRDETITLTAGAAFDIVAERMRTDFERIGNGPAREERWRIELRNRKDEDVIVTVREHFGGDWTILAQSIEGEKISGAAWEWEVPVKAGKAEVLTYTVRYR